MGAFTRFTSLFRKAGYTVVTQVITRKFEDGQESKTRFKTLPEAKAYVESVVQTGYKVCDEIIHLEIYRNKDWVKLYHSYF